MAVMHPPAAARQYCGWGTSRVRALVKRRHRGIKRCTRLEVDVFENLCAYALKVYRSRASSTPPALASCHFAIRDLILRVTALSIRFLRHPLAISKPSSIFSAAPECPRAHAQSPSSEIRCLPPAIRRTPRQRRGLSKIVAADGSPIQARSLFPRIFRHNQTTSVEASSTNRFRRACGFSQHRRHRSYSGRMDGSSLWIGPTIDSVGTVPRIAEP